MDLMSLLIRIGADISGAQKGMADVQQGMEDTAKKGTGFGSKMSAAFGTVVKAGAGLAAGVVAAGAAVTKLATGAAATTDRIDKMSQKIGISRESFQEMDFIMSQSGGSVESLQMGMKTLRTSMMAAANGTKANADRFKKLGVSIKNSKGQLRSQEDVMFDTLAALQKVGDETERTALATELFGKAGVELVPLLNSGAGSIEEMKKKAHDLGLVLDDDAIDAGVKLTDTIDQVKRSFDAVKTKIGIELFPVVQNIIDVVLDNMPVIQTVLGGAFKVLGTVVSGAVTVIGWLATPLKNVVTYLVDTFGPTFDSISSTIGTAMDAVSTAIDTAIGGIGTWLENNVTGPIKEWWTSTVQPWIDGLNKKLEPVKKDFNAVFDVIDGIFNGWNTEGDLFEVLKQLEKDIVAFVDGVVPGFKDFYDKLLKPMGRFIAGTFKTAWDGLVTLFTETLPAAVQAIQPALHDFWTTVIIPFAAFVKATFSKAWDGLVTLFTDGLPAAVATVQEVLGAFWKEVIIPFTAFIKATFSTAWSNLTDYWTNSLSPVLSDLGQAFSDFWNGPLSDLKDFIVGAFTDAWNGLVSLFGGGGDDGVTGKVNGIADAFHYLWRNILSPLAIWITDTLGAAIGGIGTVLTGLITFITGVFSGDWDKAWSGIAQSFGTIFGGIKNLVKTPINAVINFLNGMIAKVELTINRIIRAINGALSIHIPSFGKWIDMPSWMGGPKYVGFPGYSWSPHLSGVTMGRIPALANGGTVLNGGQAIVGEAGPEYLRVINGKAVVTPTTGSAGGDTYNVNISINQQPGQDPRELAEIIQRELVRIGRQKRAVYA